MNSPDLVTAAAALFNAFLLQHLVPFLILLALGWTFSRVLLRAQEMPEFDSAQFFKDDKDKLSFARVGTATCLILHSWSFAVRTLSGLITFNEVLLYTGLWSGSGTVLLIVEAWKGTRPAPPAQPEGGKS